MIKFEKQGSHILKVTCDDLGIIYAKQGSFICGRNNGEKNYKFSNIIIGEEKGVVNKIAKEAARHIAGEQLKLMKVSLAGPSTTYYADNCKDIHVMQLRHNAQITVQSKYLLAYTNDCKRSLRFIGKGVLSGNGFLSTTLAGGSMDSYVGISSAGETVALCNEKSTETIVVDPQAVVCWAGADPQLVLDVNLKTIVGHASGETYAFAWTPDKPVSVVVQPYEGDADSMVPTQVTNVQVSPTVVAAAATGGAV